MNKFIILLSLLGFVSCSSSNKELEEAGIEEREHTEIMRDYIVIDATGTIRPAWIEDPEAWARVKNKDVVKNRYFSYETDPKVSRGISCNLAKANARANIAAEISVFIDKRLSSSQEGVASIDENNPEMKSLESFVENILAEKIKAMINGASVVKTYWEKRKYLKERGAKKDFIAYTCAAFVRMNSESLKSAIEKAAKIIEDKAQSNESKVQVKEALKNINEDFEKSKKGLI